jgi:AcrR family transcriptional regulator
MAVAQPTRRPGRREEILAAALRCFTRYGYRRTSMDQIASEAQISRAALYLHFDNKEALFRELSESIHKQMLGDAESAACQKGPLEARLFRILAAKLIGFYELLAKSEHGSELADENNRLCGDVSTRSKQRFHRLLARTLREADSAGEISLAAVDLKPEAAADFVLSAAMGIEANATTGLGPGQYKRQLAQMLDLLVRGLRR